MNTDELKKTAAQMMAPGKGLLAMDESNPTCNKRFAALNIPQTEEMRRRWRELIVTTPGFGDYLSGAILFDETIRQSSKDGTPFIELLKSAGVIPGIKVDMGAKDRAFFPGEKTTEGLDGLRERLAEYHKMGARFAKWRAVITIGDAIPTTEGNYTNAHDLARYAALCQEAEIVPIVEPEVVMDGDHTMEQCYQVTRDLLHTVFDELYKQRVVWEGMILKPNMVLPGEKSDQSVTVEAVADATIHCLLETVPAAVPGIAFLSGGQDDLLASARLNAMNLRHKERLPWAVTFSYSRAIQEPALQAWHGDDANIASAQKALYHRIRCNGAARHGEYTAAMETENPQ